MSDKFTQNKLEWLEQVARDPRPTPAATRVAVVLATAFMNRQERCAWPSMPTLVNVLGISETAVRRALKSLVDRGHLTIEQGGGRATSNRYRWVLNAEKPCRNRQGFLDEKPPRKRKGNDIKPYRNEEGLYHENPADFGGETLPKSQGEPNEKNPLNNEGGIPPLSPKVNLRPQSSKIAPDAFANFIEIYPPQTRLDIQRHRVKLLRVFTAACKRGGADAILSGLRIYAANRAGQDAHYTRNPLYWLQDSDWLDPERGKQPTNTGPTHVDRETGLSRIDLNTDRDRRLAERSRATRTQAEKGGVA